MIICGIYKITNLINNKCYIGQSINIRRRWTDEKCGAFNTTDEEYEAPKSRAFRKYGLTNFTFEIIEECNSSALNERERYWAVYYNSYVPNGYNVSTCGQDGWHFNKMNKESLLELINDLKNGNETETELAKKYGTSLDNISKINVGARCRQNEVEYPIRKHNHKINYCLDCGKVIDHKATYCIICAGKHHQKVTDEQVLSELDNIYKYGFERAAKNLLVTSNSIRKRLKKLNIPAHTKEFKEWYEQQHQ